MRDPIRTIVRMARRTFDRILPAVEAILWGSLAAAAVLVGALAAEGCS